MESIKKTNSKQSLSITSLVLGILAFLFSFIPCFGVATVLIGVTAVVFGTIGITKTSKAKEEGYAMSIAGLSMGAMALLITIIWVLFIVGPKGRVFDNIGRIMNWAEDIHSNYEIDEIDSELNYELDQEDAETLRELESVLDELEGVVEDINDEVEVSVKSVNTEVKEALKEVREELKTVRKKMKSDSLKIEL